MWRRVRDFFVAACAIAGLSGSSCGRCNHGSSTIGEGSRPDGAPGFTGCRVEGRAVFGAIPSDGGLEQRLREPAFDHLDDDPPAPFGAQLGGVEDDSAGFLVAVRASGHAGGARLVRISFGGVLSALASLPASARTDSPDEPSAPLVTRLPSGGMVVGTLSAEGTGRTLALFRGDPGRPLVPQAILSQGNDESEATAIRATAGGLLVAWDEVRPDVPRRLGGREAEPKIRSSGHGAEGDSGDMMRPPVGGLAGGAGARGIVRARLLALGGASPVVQTADAAPDDVVSPLESDAFWPQLTAAPDGERVLLAWFAERAEPEDPPDSAPGEPSQMEAYRWVEAAVIDGRTGQLLALPRAITPTLGHAQAMTIRWMASGLFAVVRDDPRPTDGDGGELRAYLVPTEAGALGIPHSALVAREDVAPGAPYVFEVPGSPSSAVVAYEGLSGDIRLVSISSGAEGPVARAAAVEPALRGHRVVGSHGDLLLASRLTGLAIEFLVARCPP